MKTILLVIPSLGFGGAERAFYYMSKELSRKYNVIECIFNKEEDVVFSFSNTLVDLNVSAGNNVFQKIYAFYLRCIRLKQIKKKYKVDFTISHLEGADYINILSRTEDKIFLCIQGSKSHDMHISGIIGWVRKKILIPILYNKADHIVCVSRDIETELKVDFNLIKSSIKVIHNACDIELIQQKSQENIEAEYLNLFNNNKVLITTGRLHDQKNQSALLDVLAKLKENGNFKLVILGDGPLREGLLIKTKELNLDCFHIWQNLPFNENYQVYFLGFQQNPFKYLIKSSVFLFPSSWEGFSLALIEAMACGLPIVSTDCPTGPREALGPDTSAVKDLNQPELCEFGYLMPMLNKSGLEQERRIKNWSSITKELVEDESMRKTLSQKSVLRAQDFSTNKIYQKWIDLIDSYELL